MRTALLALLSVLSLALMGCPDGGGGDSGSTPTNPPPYVGPPRGAYSITYAVISGIARPVSLSLDTGAWTMMVDNMYTAGTPDQRKTVAYTIPNANGTHIIYPVPTAIGLATCAFIVNVPMNGVGSITCAPDAGTSFTGTIAVSPLAGPG
jgi:hypothetical protein